MLTPEQNETLTRVGPGTPMGELMRRYWMPALLSSELPTPDCPPVRVRLLGESLVAFRATSGRIGLVEESCPHRGASLWFGRNEEDGLRCVFHGWKYDVDGNCVDMMNEPDAENFKRKIHAKAYPTIEAGDVIWAYLGPKDRTPAPPYFEYTQVPASQRHVSKTWQECNWLQALEGGLDTSHAPILHRRLQNHAPYPGLSPSAAFVRGKPPTLEVDVTDYGYRYFGVRELEDDQAYVRGYHFVMPFTQIRPGLDFGGDQLLVAGHHWVPMDDENCMAYNWDYSPVEPLRDPEQTDRRLGSAAHDHLPNFRKKRNKDNQYLIDREVQKHETFSGIWGVNTQDHAVQESMGPVFDRSREHLGPADKAVIEMRKLLFQGIRVVQDGGDPAGTGDRYHGVRAIAKTVPANNGWREALLPDMYPERTPTV